MLVKEIFDLTPQQKHKLQRITADQTMIAPDGNEARLRMDQRFVKPVCVLAHFAAAVDESTREHIMIFHALCYSVLNSWRVSRESLSAKFLQPMAWVVLPAFLLLSFSSNLDP